MSIDCNDMNGTKELAEPVLSASGFEVSLLDPIDARRHTIVTADLSLKPGTVTAVVGASGGGKSTLAAALAGLIPISAHVRATSLQIDSQRCWNPQRAKPVAARVFSNVVLGPQRKLIYYVSQHARSTLIPSRTIRWHLQLAGKSRHSANLSPGMSHPDQWTQLLQSYFCGDRKRAMTSLSQKPHELSTGECQRVLFAMARVLRPEILIADEPFASLDPQTASVLIDDVRRYVESGGTLLLVTHQLSLLDRLADLGHAVVVEHGQIIEHLPLATLLRGGPLNRSTARLFRVATQRFASQNSVSSQDNDDTRDSDGCDSALVVSKLSKRFPGRSLFADQSFRVPSGCRFGIEGPSGGGKTTLARILMGLEEADSGDVIRFGVEASYPLNRRERRELWSKVQLANQDTDLVFDPNEMVGGSITRALQDSAAGKKRNVRPSRSDAWRSAERLFRDFGLEPRLLQAPPRRLSGGERKRAAIARSLALLGHPVQGLGQETGARLERGDAKILILDEPTVGLDIFHQGILAETLCDVQRQMNLTLIVLSHDHDFLSRFCDHRITWPIRSNP